jgi:hypothetical protein
MFERKGQICKTKGKEAKLPKHKTDSPTPLIRWFELLMTLSTAEVKKGEIR